MFQDTAVERNHQRQGAYPKEIQTAKGKNKEENRSERYNHDRKQHDGPTGGHDPVKKKSEWTLRAPKRLNERKAKEETEK